MNSRSRPPRRSSSAAIAHANTTSVPGRSAMCRSAGAARPVDDRHHVQIRPRHVAAPGDDQLGVLGLLGPDAGRGTEGADPRFRANAATEWTAVEQAGAEAMEEAKVHRAAGEH